MAKRPNLGQISSPVFTVGQLNTAFQKIDEAFDNTLSRDGSTPNNMSADMDLNNNDVLNVNRLQADTIYTSTISVNGSLFSGIAEGYTRNFENRPLFVADNNVSPGLGLEDGQVVSAGGLEYRRDASSTAISDLLGWVPNGQATPFHFGAVGDGVTNDRPAFVLLNAYGGDVYMPKPPVSYTVSSAINLDKPGITADPTCSWEALTDSGQITWNQNLFTQQDPPVPTHRFSGRAFFGDAAHEMAGGWATGAPSGTDDRGPEAWYASGDLIFGGYLGRDASVVIANGKGTTALSVSTRASDQWNAAWSSPIGVGALVYNDGNGEAWSSAWGHIVEGRAAQLEGYTFAMEVALGNISGVTKKITPYNWDTGSSGGVHGFWMAGGGDSKFGTPSNAPNNSPMVVLKGSSNTTLDGGWATGIVFTEDALSGTNGGAASTTFASAITMARGHRVEWNEPTTGALGFSITSRVTSSAGAWRMEAGQGALLLRLPNGTIFAQMRDNGAGGVDYPVLQNGTGLADYRADGSSSNVSIRLAPKGTGAIIAGTGSAASGAFVDFTSTTGGLAIPRMTTAQRDAISSPANGVLIYNSTTDKVQARAAGAWVDLH